MGGIQSYRLDTRTYTVKAILAKTGDSVGGSREARSYRNSLGSNIKSGLKYKKTMVYLQGQEFK